MVRQEQFHAVTLAGNSRRIVVRHWMQVTLETATENLQRWFRDLDLEPVRLPSGKTVFCRSIPALRTNGAA